MQVGVSTPIPADMQSAGIGPSDSALPVCLQHLLCQPANPYLTRCLKKQIFLSTGDFPGFLVVVNSHVAVLNAAR